MWRKKEKEDLQEEERDVAKEDEALERGLEELDGKEMSRNEGKELPLAEAGERMWVPLMEKCEDVISWRVDGCVHGRGDTHTQRKSRVCFVMSWSSCCGVR
jgi:hypothetical protein